MRLPEYVLTEPMPIFGSSSSHHTTQDLPAGACVKPLNPDYLPRHITETVEYKHIYDPAIHQYVYSRFGIHLVLRKIIRRIV